MGSIEPPPAEDVGRSRPLDWMFDFALWVPVTLASVVLGTFFLLSPVYRLIPDTPPPPPLGLPAGPVLAEVTGRYPEADLVVVMEPGDGWFDEEMLADPHQWPGVPPELEAEPESAWFRARVASTNGEVRIYSWDTRTPEEGPVACYQLLHYDDQGGQGFGDCVTRGSPTVAVYGEDPDRPSCGLVTIAPEHTASIRFYTPAGREMVVMPHQGYGWAAWEGDRCPQRAVVTSVDGTERVLAGAPWLCGSQDRKCKGLPTG